jgi:3-oxoacyl-[acyl-carrier protein] reductase
MAIRSSTPSASEPDDLAAMGLLTGKVALVTGSSRGIGAEIARLFAREGAHVVLHGRDSAALATVAAQIAQEGGSAHSLTADVTRFGELEAMRTKIEHDIGPIDILVANAGSAAAAPAPLEDISMDAWRAAIEGNLTATFLTLKSVLPGMKARRRGCIVTLSSAAARRSSPHSSLPYATAKAGIEILTQDVAAQAGPFGVRANCIAPETILTERSAMRIPIIVQERLVEAHPLRRLGKVDDVAQAALFLASPRADWITGVVLDVAGGSVML